MSSSADDDLEYSLRAVAVATQKAAFGVASAERAVRMKTPTRRDPTVIHDPFVGEGTRCVSDVELRANNNAGARDAADKVGKRLSTSLRRRWRATLGHRSPAAKTESIQELAAVTASTGSGQSMAELKSLYHGRNAGTFLCERMSDAE